MIILFSPAKQMFSGNEPPPVSSSSLSTPRFLQEARQLNQVLSRWSREELAGVMKVSPGIAEKTAGMVRDFGKGPRQPALFAYRGTSFQNLDAESLTAGELEYAQKHLRILSAMYGSLRPLDMISPYRLDMKTPLPGAGFRSLYDFWTEKVNLSLREEISMEAEDGVLINLASLEYSRIVQKKLSGRRMITVSFKENTPSGLQTVGMYAKQARGLMLKRILQEQIDDFMDMKELSAGKYKYSRHVSSDDHWIFLKN